MSTAERWPGREELALLATALGERFIQRRDLYARQRADGSYVAVYRPLRPAHFERHLRGELTLGAYVLDSESQGRFLVLDADDAPNWRRLQALAGVLQQAETSAYLETSRRGGHLWLFLDRPQPGDAIRRFGQGLLSFFHIDNIELFPKQDVLRKGPGSLIRLPFGVHRKSGQRYGFYDYAGRPLAPTLREQVMMLGQAQTVPERVWEQFIGHAPDAREKAGSEATGGPRRASAALGDEAPLSERLKATLPVRQFVLQYVELDSRGRGLCPFHDDTQPSLSVNDEGNYWHCFACERGGSVIDFYMAYHECDFRTAIALLAKEHLQSGGSLGEDK